MYNGVSNADLMDFKVGPGREAQPGARGLSGTGSIPLDFLSQQDLSLPLCFLS